MVRQLLPALLLTAALFGTGRVHATPTVESCTNSASKAGDDGSTVACHPGVDWGTNVDFAALAGTAPATLVLGCANSTAVNGSPVSPTANTYSAPNCKANGGKMEFEPASFWTTQGLVWDKVNNVFVSVLSSSPPPVSSAPTTTPPAPAPGDPMAVLMGPYPPCLAVAPYNNMMHQDLPAGVSTRYNHFSVWVCNMTATTADVRNGYFTAVSLFSSNDGTVLNAVIAYTQKRLTVKDAQNDYAKTGLPPTGSENVFIAQQVGIYAPVAAVAKNGSSKTRGVYPIDPKTGTVSGVAVSGITVAVGARCDERRRAAKSTNYFSVQWLPNTGTGNPIVGDYYATCTVTFQPMMGAN